MYNRFATTLIQFETVLFKQMKEKLEKTVTISMAAPLLRLQDTEEHVVKVAVNIDTGLVYYLQYYVSLKVAIIFVSSSIYLFSLVCWNY